MTRKRSKLKAAKTRHRSKPRPKTRSLRSRVRKTQKGGMNMSPKPSKISALEALEHVRRLGLVRQQSLPNLKIALGKAIIEKTDKERIDEDIDNEFSQGINFPIESITNHIKRSVSLPLDKDDKSSSEPCSTISFNELDNLSRSLCAVENRFNKFIASLFEEKYLEMAGSGIWTPADPDPRLYRLFYQILSDIHVKQMIASVMDGYDPSHPSQLTKEYQNSRYAQLIHSYMYKIFAGIATKYAMTDTVLKYTSPGGGGGGGLGAGVPQNEPFSELRNLCLVMRDILGMINYLFRQELTNVLGEIGDTQYCHSGGNMFYVMAMMLCYIHTRHFQGDTYTPNPPPDDSDILDQIMIEFDRSLVGEKDCFYAYLHVLMKNRIFSDLLRKITSSMSDLDFLCLTSRDTLLTEQNRTIMKDVTYLMSGILLEHCGIGCATRVDNIALNVILPDRKEKDFLMCGEFKTSTRSAVNTSIRGTTIKDHVSTRLSPYLRYLNGIKLSTNKIDAIKIFLVRIKVAMEQPSSCISDELRKIFAEKLDFVIGSVQSPFYCYKQCKFSNCDYYSLETFIHELKEILTTSRDDKSDKRDDRYQFFNILSYIDKHKATGECSIETISRGVDNAIQFSQEEKEKAQHTREKNHEEGNPKKQKKHEDMCEVSCKSGREPTIDMGRAEGDPGVLCWFNLLFGIVFQFLDPSTRNKSAKGCVIPCSNIPSFYPPPNHVIEAVSNSLHQTGMVVNASNKAVLASRGAAAEMEPEDHE